MFTLMHISTNQRVLEFYPRHFPLFSCIQTNSKWNFFLSRCQTFQSLVEFVFLNSIFPRDKNVAARNLLLIAYFLSANRIEACVEYIMDKIMYSFMDMLPKQFISKPNSRQNDCAITDVFMSPPCSEEGSIEVEV